MKEELNSTRRAHALARLENHLLRQFVALPQAAQAFELLLRRYAARPEKQFAALIDAPGRASCRFSRGLSNESVKSVRLSESEFAMVQENRCVTLEGKMVFESSLHTGLCPRDVAKATRLHLLAVGEPEEPLGVFATTDLYPATARPVRQVDLGKRLMTGIAARLLAERRLDQQAAEVRLARDMLELRSVADQPFKDPLRLIEALLEALRPKIGTETATLFLYPNGRRNAGQAVVSSGSPPQASLSARWREHETTLARLSVELDRPKTIGAKELAKYGIDSLIRTAMLLPLGRDAAPVGMIVLSRSHADTFTSEESSLAGWASKFLAQSVPRVLSHSISERQARQDGLTGLANRREWDRTLAESLAEAQQTGRPLSLLLSDLDRFKSVNDRHGHLVGDDALRLSARAMQQTIARSSGADDALIARYGGEELAVLLPNYDRAAARSLAEKLRQAVERTIVPLERGHLRITTSIGVATFPQDGKTADELTSRADAALYQAKTTGRNRVCAAQEVPNDLTASNASQAGLVAIGK